MVFCLQQGADCLHMVQLMPLHSKPPSSLASFKSRLVLVLAYPGCRGKRPLNRSSTSSSFKLSHDRSQLTFRQCCWPVLYGTTSDRHPFNGPFPGLPG